MNKKFSRSPPLVQPMDEKWFQFFLFLKFTFPIDHFYRVPESWIYCFILLQKRWERWQSNRQGMLQFGDFLPNEGRAKDSGHLWRSTSFCRFPRARSYLMILHFPSNTFHCFAKQYFYLFHSSFSSFFLKSYPAVSTLYSIPKLPQSHTTGPTFSPHSLLFSTIL